MANYNKQNQRDSDVSLNQNSAYKLSTANLTLIFSYMV